MEKYKVYLENKDFRAVDSDIVLKGSRKKRIVVDNEHNTAFLKYQNYIVNESCSEKLAYEIANLLGYNCARIELAMDAENKLCVLNYLFLNEDDEHTDAIAYINKDGAERQDYYTISNIKLMLDSLDKTLFDGFIKMMVFDALVGEQDRHEENWGIINNKNQYSFSPMYDNGCCLLREFKNEELAKEYYSGKKDFDAYIREAKHIFIKKVLIRGISILN